MNHEQIDQFDFVDRYLMGKLAIEESTSFEEHFVDCPQCLTRLQTTNRFMQDLRLVTLEQALQVNQRQPGRAGGAFLQTLSGKPLAWAVGCLLIATFAVGFWAIDHTRRLRLELAQAESVSEQWQHRYDDERQAALAADRAHQETESQLTEQQRALEAKLKAEQAQRAKMATEFSQWMRPEGNLPIFVLSAVRSREPGEAGNKITIPRSASMFFFSISLEGEMAYESYRMTFFNHQHRLIWKQVGLTPDRYNSLSIRFKAGFFQPGEYSLILEGINKAGGNDVIGNYPFLMSKTP